MTPDGSAVIAGDRAGHLRMWALPGRALLWSRDDAPTSWLAVSPDGRHLATVGNTFKDGVADGHPATSAFSVWDLRTHALELREDLTDIQYQPEPGVSYVMRTTPVPRAVAFSPDGRKAAVAYVDGFVLVYDMALRRRARWLSTFEAAPSSIAFSPDSRRLVAATTENLKEWDAATGELLSRSPVPGLHDLTRMTYTDDGQWLVISHPRSLTVLDAQTLQVAVADLPIPTRAPIDGFAVAAGQGHQLLVGTRTVLASIEMDPEVWKATACEVVGRTFTTDEWQRFLPSRPYAPACR
jgi:WD40 repeat protein